MISQRIKIVNESGLHLKPASKLCHAATKFKCNVTLSYQGMDVNAKSVLSILGAGVKSGEFVTMICEGEDEKEAIQGIAEAIAAGLGEA